MNSYRISFCSPEVACPWTTLVRRVDCVLDAEHFDSNSSSTRTQMEPLRKHLLQMTGLCSYSNLERTAYEGWRTKLIDDECNRREWEKNNARISFSFSDDVSVFCARRKKKRWAYVRSLFGMAPVVAFVQYAFSKCCSFVRSRASTHEMKGCASEHCLRGDSS